MHKLYERSLDSMNFLFLKVAFNLDKYTQDGHNEVLEILSNEIVTFLENFATEEFTPDIVYLISSELKGGEYLENSVEDIKRIITKATEYLLGYMDEDLINKYMSIVESATK